MAPNRARRSALTAPTGLEPERIQGFLSDLLRIVAKVANRDFSEKPPLVEGDDELSQFVVGFRFMIEDLERAIRAEATERAALEVANRQLKDLDVMKTRFINSAAHELGTPLTPIKLQLHMLRHLGPKDPAKAARAVEVLERNVERLEFLVSDMLDVARLQSGNVRMRRAATHLPRLVHETVDSFHAAAEAGAVSLEFTAEPELWVDIDARRVGQVFDNLVSNALKFTPRGGWIRVHCYRAGRNVRVEVHDSGTGIDPKDVHKLFQPFSQVQDPLNKSYPGSGLGLYISKGLVEQHGGQLWCHSPGPGRGATFTVELPAQTAPLVDPRSEAETAPGRLLAP